MNLKNILLQTVLLLHIQTIFTSVNVQRMIEWNTLRAKWGPDPSISNDDVYVQQPRTVLQAIQEKYEKLPNGLGDKCIGKTTLGHRYWKGNDSGIILLFDKNGIIAGIQTAFPRIDANNKYYSYDTQKMFNRELINGIEMYTLTAYFVDPAIICSVGRTLSHLESEGTGTGLFLQNGTNPVRDSSQMPLWENDIGKTKWTKGACFKTMGNHYWYDNRLDKNCSEFFPSFLLYNKKQLSAFGWSIIGKFNFSRRVEYPPKPAIFSFLAPVPICLPQRYDESGGFTTMHIYLNTDPMNLEC